MADPLSITLGCVSLIGVVSKFSIKITLFAREAHEALNDMAALRQELSTFSFSLDVLPYLCDAGKAPYPEELKRKLVGLMGVCAGIINGIEDLLDKMSSGSLARSVQCAAYGQKDMEKLRSNLKGYVLAVDCVMHTVNQYEASQNSLSLYSFDGDRSVLIESIKQDTEQIKRDTSAIRDDTKLVPGIKEDTFQIKDVLVRIQAQLLQSSENYMLFRFLNENASYAESVINDSIVDKYDEEQELCQPTHSLFSESERKEDSFQTPKLQEPNNANDDPEAHFILGKDLADKPVSTYVENENTLIGSLEDKNQAKRANDDEGLPIQLPS